MAQRDMGSTQGQRQHTGAEARLVTVSGPGFVMAHKPAWQSAATAHVPADTPVLQIAMANRLLSADLVSVSASLGRPVWAAASRFYAMQQERAGQVRTERAGAACGRRAHRRHHVLKDTRGRKG